MPARCFHVRLTIPQTPEEKHEWEDKAKSENEKQKKKQSSAKKREPRDSKHPAVTPWFAMVVDDDDRELRGFRIFQVHSGVYTDGTCKAIEWLKDLGSGQDSGPSCYLPASLYPKLFTLPWLGWIPVQVESVDCAGDAAARPSPVAVEGEEQKCVRVLEEKKSIDEAYGILAGELIPEAFPAKAAPGKRLLGTLYKHPPTKSWFALCSENARECTAEACDVCEITTGVYDDGTCKGRKWVRADSGDNQIKFAVASSQPGVLQLVANHWIPVSVEKEDSEGSEVLFVSDLGALVLELSKVQNGEVALNSFPISSPPRPVRPKKSSSSSPVPLVAAERGRVPADLRKEEVTSSAKGDQGEVKDEPCRETEQALQSNIS